MMDKTVEIRGQRVHYTTSGSGPAIILMHGWLCNASTLQSIENTAAQTHTVYNIDLPGFGGSQEPDTTWGTEDYADFIHDFVQTLGIERPSMLGHSFGGRVAIQYAAQHPVDKLILVDSAGIKPNKAHGTRPLSYYIKVYTYKAGKFVARLLGSYGDNLREWLIGKFGSPDYAQSSPMMRTVMSRALNEDLTPVMPAITAPTLLIWGDKDTATPLADAKTMETLIPGAALVSFPNCGHYSFLDNPRQFAAVLHSFLLS